MSTGFPGEGPVVERILTVADIGKEAAEEEVRCGTLRGAAVYSIVQICLIEKPVLDQRFP